MIKLRVDDETAIPLSVDSSSAVSMTVSEAFIDRGGSAIQNNKNATPSTSQVVVTPDAGFDGMAKVTVAAIPPEYIIPTGTKSITANGNGQDVVGYAAVNVNVPNSYAAGDEGKVVSNGALVSQTSDTVTANDTYDTTLINSLTVNVSGGGGISVDDMATGDEPSGSVNLTVSTVKTYAFYSRNNITELIAPNVTSIGNYGFYGLRGLKHAFLASWEGTSTSNNYCFGSSGSTTSKDCVLVFPALNKIGSRMFRDAWCKAIDIGGAVTSIAADAFYPSTYGSYKILNLILRTTAGVVIASTTDSIKGVYDLWVPQSLKSSYETASNWSARVSGGYLTVHAIEGSIYEHAYADGTPIN